MITNINGANMKDNNSSRLICDAEFISLAINSDEIEFYNVLMTPEIALMFLKKNSNNRKVVSSRVAFYASQMLAGKWKLTMEPIKINPDELIDGQHRLLACIDAGVSFPTTIATGVPSDTFDVQDTGKQRSAGDAFTIKNINSPAIVAATISILSCYRKSSVNFSINNALKLRLYELYGPEKIDLAVAMSAIFYKHTRLMSRSCYSAFYYLCSLVDPEKTDLFFKQLSTGEGLLSGSPVLTLRNKLIKELMRKSSLSPVFRYSLIIEAWNAFYLGKKLLRLQQYRYDTFVDILDLDFNSHIVVHRATANEVDENGKRV